MIMKCILFYKKYILLCKAGLQPIHIATMNGQLEVIKTLVDKFEVNPNSSNEVY